jgi:hypoxanthine phosphoribosyltransferase
MGQPLNKESGLPANPKIVVTAEQIQKRIAAIGRQITDDYQGKTLHVVCVLENGFLFAADLVRNLDMPTVCHFVKPFTREVLKGSVTTTEIFFSPELEVKGNHVLLVEGLMETGVTTEFLVRNLIGRGALSAKVATLLDRTSQRRIGIQPDYFGFLINEDFVYGYGLGAPELGRNLPYVAAGTAS